MTRAPARPIVLLVALVALALPAFAAPAQAAAQPEAPGDFRNGQDNAFGSVAMLPYVQAGEGSVPIEAQFVLRDLEALGNAADVLFAFNVKGDAVRATIEALRTADGNVLVPLRTDTVDDGRQPQAHFAPADLLAVAKEGRIDLVLAGRVEAKADSQAHVGAMAIAFDEGWGTLPSGDGSAQLYGFTMVSVTGVGGGLMPFQGQGNTWSVLPVALLALVVALAGVLAVSILGRMPATATPVAAAVPKPSPTIPAAAPIPTFGRPAQPPAAASSAVPVFGGPASPAVARPTVAVARPIPAARPPPPSGSAVPTPLQGPLLPPHPLDRSRLFEAAPAPRAASAAVAEATATLPAKPSGSGAATRPARAAARPASGGVLVAAKRPKAKPAGKPAAPPSSSRQQAQDRLSSQASR